MNDVLKQTPA